MHPMTIQELYNVGLHYGHKKEHSTPMTRPYVYSVRDGICIFDLEKTLEHLETALEAVKTAAAQNKKVLFVATKKQARGLVTALAKSVDMPYVTNRWPGGMLTNFTTIRKSLDHMLDLEKTAAAPEFAKLKKKEQKRINDEIAKLHRSFDGIKDMTNLPDMIFIIDGKSEQIAIEEANKLGVTTIATIDSNGDPTKVDMFIPCNDDAPRGLKYVLQRVGEAICEGQGIKFEAPEELSVDTSELTTVKKVGTTNGNL
ncbi:MAG TPA: 30S ribosomal protein S2 [Patescibacteria group bacterium]